MLQRVVRPATESDRNFVVSMMEAALNPYYDGDHQAHALRIFEAHIQGGHDHVGHFSEEQKMFVLEDGDERLGMINIVKKRQGTWKISPLIIAPEFQAKTGCGSELLAFAESYVRERGARQMYCTVAEQNKSASAFFRRKGYLPAGRSVSHYKPGVTEVMLYKLFYTQEELERLDKESISVVPFEDHHREGVARVVLGGTLPTYFRGVDEAWVEALFRGYERRSTGEVNQKYKLMYVATDRAGTVLGVAGVTPKKGQPIKIMPCAAVSTQAFAALLADLPQHLKSYGRKLYVHVVPSVEETIVLQRLGWTLDAMMPGAYHENYCTQQWGNTLEEQMIRTMRVKNRFFQEIMAGRKTLEVRVGYSNIRAIRRGEEIQLLSGALSGQVRVREVRRYRTFDAMLASEDCQKIVPGSDRSHVKTLLQSIYPPEKEALGVVVLDIEPTK